MEHDIQIFVDNREGHDNNSGNRSAPVRTADKAFSLLPSSWHKRAEIIFAVTGEAYEVTTDAVSFGTPVGSEASPLAIRGGYIDVGSYLAAAANDSGDLIQVTGTIATDELIGAVLTRTTAPSDPVQPMSCSIRGNATSTIHLQQAIGAVRLNERFLVQRPAVTLRLLRTLNVTSHDARSPNLTMIGIKFEPVEGEGLNLLNVRAQCDTCEFSLRKLIPREGRPKNPILHVHTDARIIGGIENPDLSPDLPSRKQAGVYIHSDDPQNLVWASRNGILSGHLTFRDITVRASQGGVLAPQSLECWGAPVQILSGGSGIGQLSWGTPSNKARIRNVPADAGRLPSSPGGIGLRVYNGSIASTLAPINLDIYGCQGDGIRLDIGSTASFGPPGGGAGLVTSGELNQGFGMNVRNASRALIGGDATVQGLNGAGGNVTLDDQCPPHEWRDITGTPPLPGTPLSNTGMSLVRVNK